MLKKRLGIECIELDWNERFYYIYDYYKIPSTLIIPKGVKEIGDYAFYDCSKAEVIIDKFEEDFKYIGNYAFSWCKSVRYVKEKIRN